MCEAAAKAVQVQCGREYGFSDKGDVKTTVLTVLDSKDLEGLPTNNLISERHFSKLDRLAKVAKSRNHQFKAKSIRNNMTLIKFNQGKVDCLSRRLSQILTAHENLWEGTQKEKLNQRIIAKVEKVNKIEDVTKQLLEDCKS